MFSKILIANRGEIACRIIKTARRMGIATVAVYSDADRRALHVQMADEAVHIGPAPAIESYLVVDKIIDACLKTGAQAVHPGYGFLSERASFVKALSQAGIVFIGPNENAIEVMGDKIASKKFANLAKVSTIPGYLGVINDGDHAVQVAKEIGLPVMIKASAGGGGKGMRIARAIGEVAQGFERARSEAAASFGDDRVFIEKFIENPRHIEIQVLGDKHDNVVYLAERECSIQRRNQKVLEEAPSSLLDDNTRREMGEQAVALARAVNYDSAGTVEFVCGQDKSFYFLEMNTRLQVEHPVTELITGVDLVEQMIRVAAGETLSIQQDDVKINGWAVESRVYAEDPANNFMPAAGRLRTYRPPAEGNTNGITVRNDTGVYEGGEIARFYDPMIAKLVTHAPTRAQAIHAQCEALDAFALEGIANNLSFLAALMHHPRWQSGALSTNFIAEEYPNGYKPVAPQGDTARRMAVAAAIMECGIHPAEQEANAPAANAAAPSPAALSRVVRLGDEDFSLTLTPVSPDTWQIQFDGDPTVHTVASGWKTDEPVWQGTINDQAVVIGVDIGQEPYLLSHAGTQATALVLTPTENALLAVMPAVNEEQEKRCLVCPMSALVVSIAVKVGDQVSAGSPLCILEAMKMEVSVDAEEDVVISRIEVKPGDQLASGDIIMEFA
ncbi:acetyl/propionyl/methylcrotonyl-CoA carboxylase subunit alpha [Pusillimonas sp. DMV24BSW_D]|uniref:acetyl-CoA carboxylase biotin carboxylase subunit n=1 Tax=Neopusillimonas aestuarii TaxID=2716226 RepID=UPI00140D60B4|nr:acetyl/propionyl/methylcrotonyl-CoA carboxylase subunit alpha [Pusillimonas sp. DMV24BSW_D]QIM48084.1 acetyl/propionyl/methylcrotonyl-CoA carboxylase subunit alpha [Pusillimonas sp. DMV24BSW_D]